jgi:hypothetical protein
MLRRSPGSRPRPRPCPWVAACDRPPRGRCSSGCTRVATRFPPVAVPARPASCGAARASGPARARTQPAPAWRRPRPVPMRHPCRRTPMTDMTGGHRLSSRALFSLRADLDWIEASRTRCTERSTLVGSPDSSTNRTYTGREARRCWRSLFWRLAPSSSARKRPDARASCHAHSGSREHTPDGASARSPNDPPGSGSGPPPNQPQSTIATQLDRGCARCDSRRVRGQGEDADAGRPPHLDAARENPAPAHRDRGRRLRRAARAGTALRRALADRSAGRPKSPPSTPNSASSCARSAVASPASHEHWRTNCTASARWRRGWSRSSGKSKTPPPRRSTTSCSSGWPSGSDCRECGQPSSNSSKHTLTPPTSADPAISSSTHR